VAVRDVLRLARESDDFRREVVTGPHSQVVVMTLQPGEEIGAETHDDADQILLVVAGEAEAILGSQAAPVGEGQLVLVPAGTRHNVVNRGQSPLRLVSVYTPPEHPAGTVHRTKAEADAAEHHH
jgi:mannose-6-phosphate isomerase-like protein (cupin superfamily)